MRWLEGLYGKCSKRSNPDGRTDGISSQETAQPSSRLGLVLISDDLHQHPFPAPAVETRVPAIPAGPKDLLPRAKVEPSVGDCYDNLTAHHAQLGELRSASDGRRRCPRRCGCGGSG
jgi:hypothetical protein